MTIIKTRFDFVINFVISFVFKIDTIDTIKSKKSVSYAKKKTIDQLIIIKKNATFSEIELKIIFEKNITITKLNVTFKRT